jgi:excisionase family DNA binding protein
VSGYLRVSDVAEDVGVSPRTVLRWVARGELPALRLPGGRLRISQTAYSAWVDANTTTNGTRTLVAIHQEGGE